jgi:hypothetical protein
MSILTDIPRRQRFDDFSERGAFHAWMRHAIIFAVIACIAALLITYLVDSRHANKEKAPEKENITEKLPVVADLPMKSKSTMAPSPSGISPKVTKSGTSAAKKTTRPSSTSKTSSTHKTTQSN